MPRWLRSHDGGLSHGWRDDMQGLLALSLVLIGPSPAGVDEPESSTSEAGADPIELPYLDFEAMTDAAISEALGMPVGTIKSRIRRARQLLGERLAQLADSSAKLESTLANLDGWASGLRRQALENEP